MEQTKKQKVEKPGLHQRIILNKFKQCHRCGRYKIKTAFHKNKAAPDGLYFRCKQCHAKNAKTKEIKFEPQPYLRNFKKCVRCKNFFTTKSFYANKKNIDGLDSYCKNCKDSMVEKYAKSDKGKEVHRKSAAKLQKTSKRINWRIEYRKQPYVKEKEKEESRKRRKTQKYKDWVAKRKQDPKVKLAIRVCQQNRRINNPNIRLNDGISGGIYRSIKLKKNNCHWETLVDFTFDQLKKHLQKQFKPGMTWDNYGKWHIDHIRPKASFNFKTPENPDFKKCWCLKNLQPLWASENCSKRDQINTPVQMSLLLTLKKRGKVLSDV